MEYLLESNIICSSGTRKYFGRLKIIFKKKQTDTLDNLRKAVWLSLSKM